MFRRFISLIIGKISDIFRRNSGAPREISIRCNPPHSEGDCSGSAFILAALNLAAADEDIISGWIDASSPLKAILIPASGEISGKLYGKKSAKRSNPKGFNQFDIPEYFSTPDLIYISSIGKNDSIAEICADFKAAPLIFGTKCRNNAAAEEIRALGGGFIIDNAAEFHRLANRLLRDPEERRIRAGWVAEYLEETANSEQETGDRG